MLKIGEYTFSNDELISRALTHSSYSSQNYERLEFLGDSILDFVVAEYFYHKTNLNEGLLTKTRSHYVSEENLCKVFDNLNIEQYVKLGKSCKQLTKSIKCDMFESIIAAIYLESGLDSCKRFIEENIFIEDYNKIELLDDKSLLQELAQSKKMQVIYTLIEQSGRSHNPTFVVEAKVGEYRAIGKSGSKQIAEQNAAKQILQLIGKGEN